MKVRINSTPLPSEMLSSVFHRPQCQCSQSVVHLLGNLVGWTPECCFFKNSFLFFEGGKGQRERKGDIELGADSKLPAVSTEPKAGLEPMNCEIVT